MKRTPDQILEYGVFFIYRCGAIAQLSEVKSIKRSRTFKEAETKLLRKMHPPKTRNHRIGLADDTLTILPVYYLKSRQA
jgi:hypothetical protein